MNVFCMQCQVIAESMPFEALVIVGCNHHPTSSLLIQEARTRLRILERNLHTYASSFEAQQSILSVSQLLGRQLRCD
jgi:hypothetical protein